MMKSKPLLLAALAVIVALGWQFTRQNKDAEGTTSAASLETTRARTTNGTRLTDAGSRRESRPSRPLATQAAELPDGEKLDRDLPNQHLARMADKLLNDPVVLSASDKAYLAGLSEQLNLTPEQISAIQALLEQRQMEMNILQARTIKDPWVSRELARVRADKSNEAKTRGDAIAALLDENQKKAFAEINAQELENRIEAQTYSEMQRLQQAVPHLTAEQKDQAFAALSEDIRRRESPDHQAVPPVDLMDGILTPEQTKAYESALPIHQVSGIGSAAGSGGLDIIPIDGITIIESNPEE